MNLSSIPERFIKPMSFLYKPEKVDYTKADFAAEKRNWEQLEILDKQAKSLGQLVGRFITHPYADGQAVYQISKEFKNNFVEIRVATSVGDDWVLPAWGEKTKISKDLAIEFLKRKDFINELFSRKDKI